MRLFLFLLLSGLAACDVASPGFYGVEKHVREVEGSTFTLRRKGDIVEAIRTSPEMLPKFQVTSRKAAIAVRDLTGCDTEWVVGDPAMMRLGLACNGRAAPKPPTRSKRLSCEAYPLGNGAFDIECTG